MKKFLVVLSLALALAMVACGEKEDTTPNNPNPPVQAQPVENPTESSNQPIELIEETVEEEVTPVMPAEIKDAGNAAEKPGIEAIEESVKEEVPVNKSAQ